MSTARAQAEAPATPTYEGIVDSIVEMLRASGALPASTADPTPWEAFQRLSKVVHESYRVPATTITPIMRRLLFGLGWAALPRHLVGVGTYVGYAFTWLLRQRQDPEAPGLFDAAAGIDIDREANASARENARALEHGERLAFLDMDGADGLAAWEHPIDLLYLDVDDPVTGKQDYRRLLEAAAARLAPGALVLAHDPCVEAFQPEFERYHEYLRQSEDFLGPWVLPIDACGLSVAARARGTEEIA